MLHVSTDAPQFRVEVYRCGARAVAAPPVRRGSTASTPRRICRSTTGDGRTPACHGEPLAAVARPTKLPVGEDWTPGVHVAYLVEGDGHGTRPERTRSDHAGRPGGGCAVRRPVPGARRADPRQVPRCSPTTRTTWRAAGRTTPRRHRSVVLLQHAPRQEVPIPFPPGLGPAPTGRGHRSDPVRRVQHRSVRPDPPPDVRALECDGSTRWVRARRVRRRVVHGRRPPPRGRRACWRRTGSWSASATTSTTATPRAPPSRRTWTAAATSPGSAATPAGGGSS